MERPIIKIILIPFLALLIGIVESNDDVNNFGLIVHGGAGSFSGLDENTLNSYGRNGTCNVNWKRCRKVC